MRRTDEPLFLLPSPHRSDGTPPPLPRAAPSVRRRLRVIAWRLRFVLAAVCLGLAAAATVSALRPEPAGVDVLVAARDLPAGTVLAASDVATVAVPDRLAVAGARVTDWAGAGAPAGSGTSGAGTSGSSTDERQAEVAGAAAAGDAPTSAERSTEVGGGGPADPRAALVGATTAVAVPAGLPLVPALLTNRTLAGPAGTVVAAVRLADDALAMLVAPGERLDLFASPGDGGPGLVVARRALVLPTAAPTGGASGGLLGGTGTPAPLLVAVAPDEAALLAGFASDVLFAVVVP